MNKRSGIFGILGLVMTMGALACGSRNLGVHDGGAGGTGGGAVTGAGGGSADAGADAMRPGTTTWFFEETPTRDVDILFMVDNSRSMLPLQTKLLANFPIFMQTLQQLPGGLPNVHIAVVSSDMGAGRNSVELCNNDQGVFQAIPRGACTATTLMSGQSFISNVNGVANYTGAIEDVFSCIAALGQDGCGFEAQLASVTRALGADGFATPPENAGFLRPNATLAIVLFTNEDDCSVLGDSDLFNTGSRLLSDPLGPLTSFRCNEFGHLCGTAPAPPSRTVAAHYQDCFPAEEQGQLIPVHTLVEQIKSLKTNPSKIIVSVIAGLPEPYNVDLVPPLLTQDPAQWPQIEHSCMENSGEYADPGIRLAAFVSAFGANGHFLTVCAPSFAPALQQIAETVGGTVAPAACIDQRLLLDAQGQPDCIVQEQSAAPSGSPVRTVIPACAASPSASVCWTISTDTTNAAPCGARPRFNVSRENAPPAGAFVEVNCAVCTPGDPRCP